MNETDETENDLSYDLAKIDLKALTKTAEIAVGRLMQNITKYTNLVGDNYRANEGILMVLNAKYLRDETQLLVICTETLNVLYGARERTEIEIVNKGGV